MNAISSALAKAAGDIELFSRYILKRPLREYQVAPARAVIASAIRHDGEQYVWRFPRQSGKNETLAHVQLYLLFLFQRVKGASIVHTAPTFDPQCRNAMRRIAELSDGNVFLEALEVSGNVIRLGRARAIYLSGQERDRPNVGSTASLLLCKDECQDLNQSYVERAFDPMTADTNAPHVHTGTARHDGTYLALKRQELETLSAQDGRQRVFIINWRDVARVNEAYGRMVQAAIRRKGAQHPVILSEYENIESERTGRLFDDRRIALIFNAATPPARCYAPLPGQRTVITIDVGGTSPTSGNDGNHDMTVASVHRVDDAGGLPGYTTIDQFALAGANVLDDTTDRQRLFGFLDLWQPLRIVVDATGLGVGLASALARHWRARVVPFRFSAASKTQLLNDWLALIETGRYKHYRDDSVDCQRFIRQLEKCEHTPHGAMLQWGIPAHVTWRHPITLADEPLHDDHLISAALVAALRDGDALPREAVSQPAARRLRRAHEDD